MNPSQRQYFNERVGAFDTSQPPPVIERLGEIVSAAGLYPGEVVLDVGTGVGVLIPLIQSFRPSRIVACDIAERMLQCLQQKYPQVETCHSDVADLPLDAASIDVTFLNAMYGNIADKPRACQNVARMLREGGRMVVSHPEGRAFVEELRRTSPLPIESFPDHDEFQSQLKPLGLEVIAYRDEPKLYLMVARKGHYPRRNTKEQLSTKEHEGTTIHEGARRTTKGHEGLSTKDTNEHRGHQIAEGLL